MEKRLVPAPIDEKNVTTDWIENIFDCQSCVYGKGAAVGFINDKPVFAKWSANVILWQFPNEVSILKTEELDVLQKRLKAYDDANEDLLHEYNVIGDILVQKFYWKSE